MTTRFTVNEDHLKLLRAANIQWDAAEYGAPGIDPKRPYGNSSVLTDIAEIVNPQFKDLLDDREALDWLEGNAERLERLHRETETVLRIGVQTGRFTVGEYEQVAERYHPQQWRRVESL